MLTTTTALQTQQLDPPLPPPTLFLAPESELPTMLKPTTQSTDDQSNLPPAPLATSNLLTAIPSRIVSTDPKCPLLHTFATPSMPMRSRITRIINQMDDSTIALWTPNAVHRRLYVNRSNGPDTTPAHPTELDNRTHYSATIPKYTDNPRPTTHATTFLTRRFTFILRSSIIRRNATSTRPLLFIEH